MLSKKKEEELQTTDHVMQTGINARKTACMYVHMHVCMCVCMYVGEKMCMYMPVYVCVHICMCMYVSFMCLKPQIARCKQTKARERSSDANRQKRAKDRVMQTDKSVRKIT